MSVSRTSRLPRAVERAYAWQRDAAPRTEPVLRFDTHFQEEGLPVPPHADILIGVSGGSDSLALLHLLVDWRARNAHVRISAATVDHGLRPEAADEAAHVADICKHLSVPHAILRDPAKSVSSAAQARDLRFDLLDAHAHSLGISCLMLGHTYDDQAETILMRALRGGGTVGLAGMARTTMALRDGHPLDIIRPLLAIRRGQLQAYLREHGIRWVDDPSNHNRASERVRARSAIAEPQTPFDKDAINRLGALSARMRAWMDGRTARFIDRHARQSSDGLHLTPFPEGSDMIALHALAACIRRVGRRDYPLPVERAAPVLLYWQSGTRFRFTVGRCLLVVDESGLSIGPERRHPSPTRNETTLISSFDRQTQRVLDRLSPLPR